MGYKTQLYERIMYKKDTLFRVIHSMTEEEVRNFYRGISYATGKDKSYLVLFKILRKQFVYDEKDAEKKLLKAAGSKNFAKIKLYLLELLFDTLDKFKALPAVNTQIIRTLYLAELFFQKSEYSVCQIFTSKANKLIRKSESFQEITWYSQLNINLFKKGIIPPSEVIEYTNEYYEYKKKMDNISEYMILELNSFMIVKNLAEQPEKQVESYKQLLTSPFLTDINNATTISSKVVYYNLHRTFARITRDHKLLFDHTYALVTHYQNNPEFIKYYIFHYLSALANLGDAALMINDYNTFEYVNTLIESHKDTDLKNSNKVVVLYSFHAKLIKFRRDAKYAEGIALLEEFHSFNKKSKVKMYDEIEIIFLLHSTVFYFANHERRRFQIILNRLGELVNKKENNHFFILHKLLELLKACDQHDFDFANSKLRSIDRYMDIYPHKEEHKLVINSIKESLKLKASANDSEDKQRKIFASLAQKLNEHISKTHEYEEFPFSYWANAKALGINLIEYKPSIQNELIDAK